MLRDTLNVTDIMMDTDKTKSQITADSRLRQAWKSEVHTGELRLHLYPPSGQIIEILEDSLLVSHHSLPLQPMPFILIAIIGVLSISLCRELLGFSSHSDKYKTIKCRLALGKVTITALCLQMNFYWVLAPVIFCKKPTMRFWDQVTESQKCFWLNMMVFILW